jgi:uncharacterized protein
VTVRLAEIRVHPLKGMRGIRLQRAELDTFGIRWDRHWMLTRPDGTALTQREHPSLVLVTGELGADLLTLHGPHTAPLELPLHASVDETVEVEVWRDRLPALPCGPGADRWFEALLGAPCRLVRLPPRPARWAGGEGDDGGRPVAFTDGEPLHLVSRSSLDDLNRRLPQPVEVERFRPNLVVEGAAPYAEDGWRALRIGAAHLEIRGPCERCVVTTVDPDDASRGAEPLRTLAGYRRGEAGGVHFGVYAAHRVPAALRVGDPVEVVQG